MAYEACMCAYAKSDEYITTCGFSIDDKKVVSKCNLIDRQNKYVLNFSYFTWP